MGCSISTYRYDRQVSTYLQAYKLIIKQFGKGHACKNGILHTCYKKKKNIKCVRKCKCGEKHYTPLPCKCHQNILFSVSERSFSNTDRQKPGSDGLICENAFFWEMMMIRDWMSMGWSIIPCSPGSYSCPGHVMLHDLHHNVNSNPGLRDKKHCLITLTKLKQVQILYQGVAISQNKV